MASFRIHEDQENIHVGDIRRNVKEVFPQKRNVLGSINTNSNQFDGQTRGSKQVLKSSNIPNIPLATNENNENYQPKKYASKQPTPAVPVAQFEAFKVYEENIENKKRVELEKKVSEPEVKCRVNEKTTKEEIKVPQVIEEPLKNDKTSLNTSAITDLPMSIDKSLLVTQRSDIIYDIKEYDIYRDDIYKYMRECETRHRPKPGYMRKQPDITYSMRTVLVDWLVEVAEEYKLQPETLFLAVSYIDRFLSYMSVVRAKLQLVGTAAMFIAAKYEEIYPPDVGEFVYITDDTYNKKQVLRMEHLILKVLSFDLSVPTPLTFVREFCTTNNFDEKTTSLAMYLIELSLLEADPYLQFLPSHIASSAIALARYNVDDEPWPKEFEQSTRYSLEYLRPCIAHLHTTFSNASTLEQQAVQEKYKHSKYHHVSLILPKDPITDFIDLQHYLPATEQQQQQSLTAQQAFEQQVQK